MKMIVHYIVSTVRDREAVCGTSYVVLKNNDRRRIKDNPEFWDLFDTNPADVDCPYCKATVTWKQARLKQLLSEKQDVDL
jgi:hypothetical protein